VSFCDYGMCGIALAIRYVSEEEFIDRKLTNIVCCVFEAFLIVPLEHQNNKQKRLQQQTPTLGPTACTACRRNACTDGTAVGWPMYINLQQSCSTAT